MYVTHDIDLAFATCFTSALYVCKFNCTCTYTRSRVGCGVWHPAQGPDQTWSKTLTCFNYWLYFYFFSLVAMWFVFKALANLFYDKAEVIITLSCASRKTCVASSGVSSLVAAGTVILHCNCWWAGQCWWMLSWVALATLSWKWWWWSHI